MDRLTSDFSDVWVNVYVFKHLLEFVYRQFSPTLTGVDQQSPLTSVSNQEKKPPGSNVRISWEVMGVIIMVFEKVKLKWNPITFWIAWCFAFGILKALMEST